jgi:hypothetical protein
MANTYAGVVLLSTAGLVRINFCYSLSTQLRYGGGQHVRAGVVIDSACDLLQSYIQDHNIHR